MRKGRPKLLKSFEVGEVGDDGIAAHFFGTFCKLDVDYPHSVWGYLIAPS